MKSRFDFWKIVWGILLASVPVGGGVSAYVLNLQIASIKSDVKQEVLKDSESRFASKQIQESLQQDVQEIKADVKEVKNLILAIYRDRVSKN